jgi:integrase
MTTQPIRDKKHIRQISVYFQGRGEYRNLLLFVRGIHTALRVSDMLRLTWNDVYNFSAGRARREFSVTEKKTRKGKTVAVNHKVAEALNGLFRQTDPAPEDYIFANPYTRRAISRIQAYRVLRAAAAKVCAEIPVSCHSLRKTFGYHLWKRGVAPVVIMDIYNHSSYAVTKRYLSVTQDDRNSAYLGLTFDT